MKKLVLCLLIALAVAMSAFSGLSALAGAENVPQPLVVENVALGKEVSLKSLTDMTVDIEWSAYWPDSQGFYGQTDFGTMASLTDGDPSWASTQNRSTAAANTHGWFLLDLGKEYSISQIKVGYLSAWGFSNVVIQVSNDPTFAQGVTTVFAVTDTVYADDGETVVYNGGQVGCSVETMDLTGWNGSAIVNSANGGLRVYDANSISARYVRLTNSDKDNGGAFNVSTICELQVFAATSGIVAPKASVASGTYESMTSVTLSSAYTNAEIYYTLDGSYPTANSTKYEGAIDLSAKTGAIALRTVAIVDGVSSESANYVYKVATPIVNKALGKTVSVKDIKDMSKDIDIYAYFPDGNSNYFTGGGQYTISNAGGNTARLTDGNTNWDGWNSISTAAYTLGWFVVDLEEEVTIDSIKVGMLAAWCFRDVIIQVSNDPLFKTGVTTVFALRNSIDSNPANNNETDPNNFDDNMGEGDVLIYEGGRVVPEWNEQNKALTGWNGIAGIDSANHGLLTYNANGVKARYVRVTNNTYCNGGALYETVFNEIQVWNKAEVLSDPEIKDTVKSATEVANTLKVTPGTTLNDVIAQLPSNVTVATMNGETSDLAINWTSADWVDSTAGTFTFTGSLETLAVDDVFGIIPENYTVTVTVEKADTSAVDALIAEVEALDSTIYTAKTWSVLASAIANAKEGVESLTVTTAQLEEYALAINNAREALKLLATDKSELATAISTADAIVLDNYMSTSINGFDAALAAAKTVNEDNDASVGEVTAVLNDLNAVLNALVEKGDLVALATLIKNIDDANLVADNYTELTWAVLVDALDKAREVANKTEAPKTAVDGVYAELNSAYEGLVAYGDKTALNALVNEYATLVAGDYTVASWATFTAKLDAANAVLAEKVMQDVLDNAKAELETAKNALVSLVALRQAIDETIDETLYTAISVQVYNDAKAEAQLVLDNGEATAEEVEQAISAINQAKEALVEIPVESTPEIESTESESKDDNTSEETSDGCAGSVSGLGASVVLAVLGAALIAKKKED